MVGVNIALTGGTTYSDNNGTIMWSYTNLHGDTITTLSNSGAVTWTGYWGPYGENASGTTPTNTALANDIYGYNGAQGRLSNPTTGIILMGARPYQAATGRFLTVDPIQGGCANAYTYAYGDPVNHPDLSGQLFQSEAGDNGSAACNPKHHSWWDFVGTAISIAGAVVGVVALTVATGGGDLAVVGIAAVVLGGAGVIVDSINCANQQTVVTYGDIALAAAGVVGGLGAVFKDVGDLSAAGTAAFGAGTDFGIAAGTIDAVDSFAPAVPCVSG